MSLIFISWISDAKKSIQYLNFTYQTDSTWPLQLKIGEFWYLEAPPVPEIDVLFIGLRIVINKEECNLYMLKYAEVF